MNAETLEDRVQFFIDEVEREEAHRNRSPGGQQVSHHGDFAAVQMSGFTRLKWWARCFKDHLENARRERMNAQLYRKQFQDPEFVARMKADVEAHRDAFMFDE